MTSNAVFLLSDFGHTRAFVIFRCCLFEVIWPRTKWPLNWTKPENISLLRKKNTKEIIINHKGTRMGKDREDWPGSQTTTLNNLCLTFKISRCADRNKTPLMWIVWNSTACHCWGSKSLVIFDSWWLNFRFFTGYGNRFPYLSVKSIETLFVPCASMQDN